MTCDAHTSMLRWRCRRGMRELDTLMVGWLDQHFPTASDEDRTQFESLLALQDPELMTLIKSTEARLRSQMQCQMQSLAQTPERQSANTDINATDCNYDRILEQICKVTSI